MENPVTLSRVPSRDDASSASPQQQAWDGDRRRLRRTLARTQNMGRLLAWIDSGRAATWPVERNVLGLMTLLGLALVLAIRSGLIVP